MKKPDSGVQAEIGSFYFGQPDCSSCTRSTLFQATEKLPLATLGASDNFKNHGSDDTLFDKE